MPMYEYVCEADGSRLTLLRPMRDADEPVEDPEGKGRVFKLAHSTFMTGSSTGDVSLPTTGGGMCGCGRPHGSCGAG
ncbi:MAG: zinc ribbon domain-containing protein [Phycisphaerales bacterium]|nr:zinc ribbon domain-containing protein [Phycisphaerales bacterium]